MAAEVLWKVLSIKASHFHLNVLPQQDALLQRSIRTFPLPSPFIDAVETSKHNRSV